MYDGFMVRLACVVALLGACGFHIGTGSSPQDGGGDDGSAMDRDSGVDDAIIDEPPPIDGNHADWWDPLWTKRRRITLDTSSLTGNVTDFPVLVRLPPLTGTLPNGGDLRFVSLDGQKTFPYELEGFNALAQSPVWIQMTLTNATDTELWVYYGNLDATPASSGATVFGGNHVSVHHLGGLVDASGNGHNASNTNPMVPAATTNGRIGAARTFDGNDDYLVLGNSNGAYDFSTAMYASAWVRVAGFEDAYQAIITKGDSSWRMARANTGSGVGFGWTNGGTNGNLLGDTPINDGEWHHVAIVQTQTTKYVFVDGAEDVDAQNNEQLDNNEYSVRIGMNEESNSPPARYWHGDIDEVRISAGARDAAWIFAEYRTTDPLFAMVGGEEVY